MKLTDIYEQKSKELFEKSQENLNNLFLPMVRSYIERGKRKISFSCHDVEPIGCDARALMGYDKIIVIFYLSIPVTNAALNYFCEKNSFKLEEDNDAITFDPSSFDESLELIELYNQVRKRKYEESMRKLNFHLLMYFETLLKSGFLRAKVKFKSIKDYTSNDKTRDEHFRNAYFNGYDVVIYLNDFFFYVTEEALNDFCSEHSLIRTKEHILFEFDDSSDSSDSSDNS